MFLNSQLWELILRILFPNEQPMNTHSAQYKQLQQRSLGAYWVLMGTYLGAYGCLYGCLLGADWRLLGGSWDTVDETMPVGCLLASKIQRIKLFLLKMSFHD